MARMTRMAKALIRFRGELRGCRPGMVAAMDRGEGIDVPPSEVIPRGGRALKIYGDLRETGVNRRHDCGSAPARVPTSCPGVALRSRKSRWTKGDPPGHPAQIPSLTTTSRRPAGVTPGENVGIYLSLSAPAQRGATSREVSRAKVQGKLPFKRKMNCSRATNRCAIRKSGGKPHALL